MASGPTIYRTRAANGETRVSRHRHRWMALGGVAEEPVTADQLTEAEQKQLDREAQPINGRTAMPTVDLSIKYSTTERLVECLDMIDHTPQEVDPLRLAILRELARRHEAARRPALAVEAR